MDSRRFKHRPSRSGFVSLLTPSLHTHCSCISRDQLAHVRGTDRFTLDLALSTTPLPAPAAYRPQYAAGLLAHLDAVVDEYLESRGARPLRLVLTGPPMAGN